MHPGVLHCRSVGGLARAGVGKKTERVSSRLFNSGAISAILVTKKGTSTGPG